MVLIYREVDSSFTTRDLAVRSLLCSILRQAWSQDGFSGVFSKAKLLRIADCLDESRDNRRGNVELFAHPAAAINAILKVAIKGSHLLEWLREMPSPVISENSRVARTGLDASKDCSN
jgi:hypothetical protein